MNFPASQYAVPQSFLAVCAGMGVGDATIVAHLDADEFYAALDDRSQYNAIARHLLRTQAHPVEDIRGIVAMFDLHPERVANLLEAGLTGDNARRYAGRNVNPARLEATYRHELDLAVLDDLIEETEMPFESMAVLLANRIPADWLSKNAAIPGRHLPDAAYRVFCEWAWQTSNSDLPDDYLDEMFLGKL